MFPNIANKFGKVEKSNDNPKFASPNQITSGLRGPLQLFLKGIVSPPERCDFTSSQQYNYNVL